MRRREPGGQGSKYMSDPKFEAITEEEKVSESGQCL